MELFERLGMGVGRLPRLMIFRAEFRNPEPQVQVQPLDRRAIGLALQLQPLQEAVCKGAMLYFGDLVRSLAGAAGGYRDHPGMGFGADALPVPRALVAARVE